MLNWIRTHKLATAGIAIVLIYVIVSLIKKEWNPMKWFSASIISGRIGCPKKSCFQNGTYTGSVCRDEACPE